MTSAGPNGAFFKGPRATKLDPKARKLEDERVYRVNRAKAFAREKDRCQMCRRKATNAHHIRSRAQSRGEPPERRHDPDYLLVVCGSGTTGCHGEIEAATVKVYGSAVSPAFTRWNGSCYEPWTPPVFGSAK
jgi:hypothetical protein